MYENALRGSLCRAVLGGERALLKTIISVIVAILIIVWIVSNPAGAGDTVHSWITGIFTFFHHLA
jgi:hypothetical protein